MSSKKLIYRIITCAFLIPILIVPFTNIFGLNTEMGNVGKYGMFAKYDNTPFGLLGGNINTFWMIVNNAFVIILFICAIIFIVLFILDIAKIDVKNADKIMKYLGILILASASIAVLAGLIGGLTNSIGDPSNTFAKIYGEPGYYLQLFPIVSGILLLIPIHEE